MISSSFVRDPKNLWEAWVLSQKLQKKPSEIYFISDELTAYSFDKAVVSFGIEVEADLDEHTKNEKKTEAIERKREQRFSLWMNEKQMFRDPANR